MNERRTYSSPLRSAQTEQTRHLILDTLAEMAAEESFDGIVVNDLAARAGLAARTVYRHFPDRDALHDALADRMAQRQNWTDDDLGPSDGWPERVADVYALFDEHEVPTTVVAKLNAVRARTAADSVRRRNAFREQIRAGAPDLDDKGVEALLAVIQVVASSRTWLRLKEELGMTGAESGPIMRWVVEAVLA